MRGRFTVKATWAELMALYRLTMDAPPHNTSATTKAGGLDWACSAWMAPAPSMKLPTIAAVVFKFKIHLHPPNQFEPKSHS